jgi:hypothetical protein
MSNRYNVPLTFMVLPQVVITPALLTSSSVPEPGPADPAAWVSGGAYTVGQTRYRATTHRIYECIQNVTGSATLPENDLANWRDLEATQRWKMLDPYQTKATSHTSPMVVEVAPGQRVDAWRVGGVSAQQLLVQMFDGAVEVYRREVTMTRRNTRTWSDYFFGTFDAVPAAMDDGMPLISGATIRFTFTSTTGTVSVRKLSVGRAIRIGVAEAGAEADAENYSRIDRSDIDGSVTLVPRRNVPRNSMTVYFNPADTDILLSLRDRLNAVPAVWSALGTRIGEPYFNAFQIYGIYTRFVISADSVPVGRLSLELEEL